MQEEEVKWIIFMGTLVYCQVISAAAASICFSPAREANEVSLSLSRAKWRDVIRNRRKESNLLSDVLGKEMH